MAWLGLCAWLVDMLVIIETFAMDGLSSTARTSLHVAAKDVQLSFGDAAIVTGFAICSPIVSFIAVTDALQNLSANTKCQRNSIVCHT